MDQFVQKVRKEGYQELEVEVAIKKHDVIGLLFYMASKENKITPNDPTYSIEFKMYLLTQMSSSIVWGHASGISTTKKVF